MALLADAEREKLTKKLSEANQQNRFLKRQVRAIYIYTYILDIFCIIIKIKFR